MLKNKLIKNKKGQTVQIVIMLVVGLVVVGILIYLGYKYILGTGKNVGELGTCTGQGGKCVSGDCPTPTEDWDKFYGMGCPTKQGGSEVWCCLPKSRTSG